MKAARTTVPPWRLVLLSVLIAVASLAVPQSQARGASDGGPCYWGSPTYTSEAVANPEYGMTFYSKVNYKIGYTCTGTPTHVKVVYTKFVHRATQPHPIYSSVKRTFTGHSVYRNFNNGDPIGPYWVWDSGKYCYNVCTITAERWPTGVQMYISSTNVHVMYCRQCTNLGGTYQYRLIHQFRTGNALSWKRYGECHNC